MAHLNWEKTKSRYEPVDYSNQNQYDVKLVAEKLSRRAELWPISGKYKGTKLKDLPLSYLEWVGMNFDTNSKGFKLAVQELECRTNRT